MSSNTDQTFQQFLDQLIYHIENDSGADQRAFRGPWRAYYKFTDAVDDDYHGPSDRIFFSAFARKIQRCWFSGEEQPMACPCPESP